MKIIEWIKNYIVNHYMNNKDYWLIFIHIMVPYVLLPIILHILIGWWSVLVLAIVWIILQVPFEAINVIKLMNITNKITENETFEDNLNMIHEDEQ